MNWNELAPKVDFEGLNGNDLPKKMFPGFSIWEWGTGRFSMTLGGMKTTFPDGQVTVVDYEYEHSRNMRAPTSVGMKRGLTLCFLKHSGLDLPVMYMRNEAPINKMFKRAVGRHDIFFAEDPEFSDRFEVQGPEAQIHQLFRPEVRSYFMRHFEYSPLRLETGGDTILLHFGMMIRPEDSRMLVYRVAEMAGFWSKGKIDYEIPPEFFFKGRSA